MIDLLIELHLTLQPIKLYIEVIIGLIASISFFLVIK